MIENYFDESVTIERVTRTDTNIGGWTESWDTHLTVDGKIRPLSGSERLSADKQTLYADYRLYCDNADITAADRAVSGGVTYDIVFVKNVMHFDRHMEIDLLMRGHENAI
jgi:SPP1 family predicted phage head-tail adaptor